MEVNKTIPMLTIDIKPERLKAIKRSTKKIIANPVVNVIIETVSKESGIPIIDILEMSRKREIVTARHLAMYFIKEHTDYSLKKIGSFFSNRDHSTIIHANQSVEDLIDTDKKFKLYFTRLSAKVADEVYVHNICGHVPAKIF